MTVVFQSRTNSGTKKCPQRKCLQVEINAQKSTQNIRTHMKRDYTDNNRKKNKWLYRKGKNKDAVNSFVNDERYQNKYKERLIFVSDHKKWIDV